MQEAITGFEQQLPLEIAESQLIFEPILNEVLAAASALEAAPQRNIVLATSPDSTWTGAVVPSDHEHIVFLGPGLFSFCNYWSKAYAQLVRQFATSDSTQRINPASLTNAWRQDHGPLLLAAKLALHCGHFDTSLGFGEVQIPFDDHAYRNQLLIAMETFVVAHEVGHCMIKERNLESSHRQQIELICDEYAIAISRTCESLSDNWLNYTGSAAILLLRSFRLCDLVREKVKPNTGDRVRESTHPGPMIRIQNLTDFLSKSTPDDQLPCLLSFLVEIEELSDAIEAAVLNCLQTGA